MSERPSGQPSGSATSHDDLQRPTRTGEDQLTATAVRNRGRASSATTRGSGASRGPSASSSAGTSAASSSSASASVAAPPRVKGAPRDEVAEPAVGAGEESTSLGAQVKGKLAAAGTAVVAAGSAAGKAASSVGSRVAEAAAPMDVPPAAPAPRAVRRTRKARLRLSRIDPWSVMKTAFLFGIAGGIILFVAVWVVWGVVMASGAFDSINKAVNDLLATGTNQKFDLERYVNTSKVLGFTAMIGVADVVIFTALATLFSFLYNLAATVLGGLEVTLAED